VLRQWVLHGGGFLGVVASTSFVLFRLWVVLIVSTTAFVLHRFFVFIYHQPIQKFCMNSQIQL
jgi:hypothetical protein